MNYILSPQVDYFCKFYNEQIGGPYKNDSDDMVIVCRTDVKDEVIKLMYEEIEDISLNYKKQRHRFFNSNEITVYLFVVKSLIIISIGIKTLFI